MMANPEIRIFYSWQSDLPNNETRGLIQDAIESAVKLLRNTVEIVADRDVKDEFGSPDVVQTIFSKIDDCDIFIADVSVINKYHSIDDNGKPTDDVKLGPNPNVMLELGYAASTIGWNNVICIIDTDYGIIEDLPFDLVHHRPSPYSLKKNSKGEVKKYIRDIIIDTVNNLLENGQRVKKQFSNITVGSFISGKAALSKELIPFSPYKYFHSVIKKNMTDSIVYLIRAINNMHLERSAYDEDNATSQSNTSPLYAPLGNYQLFPKSHRVYITEADKKVITDYVSEHPDIVLSDDFFELGNLKEQISYHIAGGSTTLTGSESEKKKHDMIFDVYGLIVHLEIREQYVKTFNDYLLFPLAIRNISTNADSDINVSITIDKASSCAIVPTKDIFDSESGGLEGSVYEDGIIKELLLMRESSEIKYETDISFSYPDELDSFKAWGINGAHYDTDDYEHELSKYIEKPNENGTGYEYEYHIDSLRPGETHWLGAMIMLKANPTAELIEFQYSIISTKSNGNLSGSLLYSLSP